MKIKTYGTGTPETTRNKKKVCLQYTPKKSGLFSKKFESS
jgi:hypothetical protein